MALLEWKPEYSLDNPAVDYEHREMIDLINRCYASLDEIRNPAAIERFLGDIHASISAHFALEENIMRRAAYSEYEAHKEHHEVLLDEIRVLMDAFMDDPESGAEMMREKLGNWFAVHFSTFDARLHHHLPHQV